MSIISGDEDQQGLLAWDIMESTNFLLSYGDPWI